jgi:hypothetical protein
VLRTLLLVATAWLALTAATQPADPPKSVLILLGGQPGLPAAAVAAGVRAAFVEASSPVTAIETEYVDTAQFTTPAAQERRLRDIMRVKYAARPFDLILIALDEPLGFFLRVRDELWPGVPAVVCAVDERAAVRLTLPADVTLVTVRYDMAGALRAALALLPDTRHVALAGGSGPMEQPFHDFAREAVSALGAPLDLIDLTGLSLPDLYARLAVLPARTIVLASSYQMRGTKERRGFSGDGEKWWPQRDVIELARFKSAVSLHADRPPLSGRAFSTTHFSNGRRP